MNGSVGIVLAALLACLGTTGCVFVAPVVMPATSLDCSVVDHASSVPLKGAEIRMVYEGPRGEIITEGPFITDESGFARVTVNKRRIWMKGTDLAFAGGYLRRLEVHAPGYEPNGRAEQFNHGLLEKEAPFTFRMERLRNRFGAVRVLAHERQPDRERLLLEVLDGPERGTQLSLPIMPLGSGIDLTSKRLYLRESLEDLRSETARYGVRAFRFETVLREGLAEEPYEPDE